MSSRSGIFSVLIGLLLFFSGGARAEDAALPRPDHVVVVIDENKAFSDVIGNADAPYINSIASRSAIFTESYALAHPSQPNYLMLFAGSNLGVVDNSVPKELPFSVPNLGAELIAKGLTFCGYAEDLPVVGFTGAKDGNYVRKHNPWVNWQGASRNAIPPACNQPFSSWPQDLSLLPTVAFVIPNLQNDMHDGTIAQGSAWLKDKLDGYVQWAAGHNSLLIVTFDEDDLRHNQRIPTFFVGPMARAGKYAQRITHYDVLRTIEDFYGLPPSGKAARAKAINFCWRQELRDQVGQRVTLFGPFSLWGKESPFIKYQGEVIYIIPKGSFSWGPPYSAMEGRQVSVTGTLQFRHFKPSSDETVQTPPDYFYFEWEDAAIQPVRK